MVYFDHTLYGMDQQAWWEHGQGYTEAPQAGHLPHHYPVVYQPVNENMISSLQ